jgi:hypothetical protein
MKILVSDEADLISEHICFIYVRLALAPDELWESESVLCLKGSFRPGQAMLPWQQGLEMTKVPAQELKKSLEWMQEKGMLRMETDEEQDLLRLSFIGLIRPDASHPQA